MPQTDNHDLNDELPTDMPEDSEAAATEESQLPTEDFEHKYKLALADYQNLLKQTAKDRRDSILYANQALILEMLPVYDNLKLSVKHGGEESSNQWLSGITYVIAQFKKALEDAGVKEVLTAGQPFDPATMEAVENRPTEDKKIDGQVAEELKGGYLLNEKVLIPARVAVYKLS